MKKSSWIWIALVAVLGIAVGGCCDVYTPEMVYDGKLAVVTSIDISGTPQVMKYYLQFSNYELLSDWADTTITYHYLLDEPGKYKVGDTVLVTPQMVVWQYEVPIHKP